MKHLWSKRRLGALGALAAAVGVTLWVVLPAFASSPGDSVPWAAHPSNITPIDVGVGGNGTCTNLFDPTWTKANGYYEYDNANPKTISGDPSGNNDKVSFDITMSTGKDHDKYFSFVAHGAAVLGVGVNGGSDTTVYDYVPNTKILNTYPTQGVTAGYVTHDGAEPDPTSAPTASTGLHAPEQSTASSPKPSDMYSVSHLTFCYVPAYTCSSTAPFGPTNYQIQLAACTGKTEPFFFNSGTNGGTPYVSVSSANTSAAQPLVERAVFDDPIPPGGPPTYTGIQYTDVSPFDFGALKTMRYCQLDPRQGLTGTTLATAYLDPSTSGSVLPTGDDTSGPGAPSPATSCLISVTTSVVGPPDSITGVSPGKLVAYIYSTIDGLRTAG